MTTPDQRAALRAETSAGEPCPICGGVGFIRLKVPVGHPLFGKAVPCRCKRQEMAERRLERLRRTSNLRFLSHMTFEAFRTTDSGSPMIAVALQEALNTAREFAENPKGWLVFTGSYGSGKTHLAAAIANYRLEQGLPVLFIVTPDLLDYLRASYAPNSPSSYNERFEQVRTIELLVLDDLGTQNATPWAAEKLYQLLNYRYNAGLPTVITTNQSIEAMDPRLSSRLRHEGLVTMVPMYQPDYRARTEAEGISRKLETFGSLNLYEAMTFETFSDRKDEIEPAQSAALRRTAAFLEGYAEHPTNWVLLRGGYHVGKTHLAAAVANKVTRNGLTALFVVVPDLLDHLRATFQPGTAISYDERFNEVRRTMLLVLDDLGSQSATPWAQEKLFQILNYRYVTGLATVITITTDGWERLDERLRSRLLDSDRCTIIDVNVPSYRGKVEAKTPRRSTRRRI
ncbi:MAG TPA: ATP-binding protein [Chloroflexi bacterium]|jgi:DNA replication protein DnaC|nr:ATP-binding protein [Chloroflexota bacterium]